MRYQYAIIIEDRKPKVFLDFDPIDQVHYIKLFDTMKEANDFAAERFSLWSILAFEKQPYTCAGGATYDVMMAEGLVNVPPEIL
jgi:hypothetical protein